MYLSVYDRRDNASEPGLFPSFPSSLTHVHRCIGYHNPNWNSLSKSARLTYLSVYDNRQNQKLFFFYYVNVRNVGVGRVGLCITTDKVKASRGGGKVSVL